MKIGYPMVHPKLIMLILRNGLLGPMGPVFKQPWVALGQASHGKGDERDQGRSDARNPQRLPGKRWVNTLFVSPITS